MGELRGSPGGVSGGCLEGLGWIGVDWGVLGRGFTVIILDADGEVYVADGRGDVR